MAPNDYQAVPRSTTIDHPTPTDSGAHGLQLHDISTNRRTTATRTKVSVDNSSASWESLRTQPYLTALRTLARPGCRYGIRSTSCRDLQQSCPKDSSSDI